MRGEQQKKILVWLGSGIILLFIGLRLLDVYGDPDVLTATEKPLNSVYSFLEYK